MKKSRLTEQQTRRIKAQRSHSADASPGHGERGLVIARYGKQALVEHASGDRMLCHLRSHLDSPVAGDIVLWMPSEEAGVITAVVERRNVLERPDSHGSLRPVAANIDLIMIVLAPEPALQPNLLDRYLIAAEHMTVEPVLVLNKTDLITDSTLPDELARYEGLGYRTLTTDHHMPDATDLLNVIGQRTLVLVGQSGVGKSSLIQRLLPDASIRIGALSEVADKGRHTTTTAELFHLPGAGKLIDSPGVREFGLGHVAPEDVDRGFREFLPYLGHCRFRDCKHLNEPGCALKGAASAGEILAERFSSYQQIRASLQDTH
jgi:ribosome biogenesis GTPase / thiamine phosphate phosphatase